MYISKYSLNTRNKEVSEALSDADKMHKIIWGLFLGMNDFAVSREGLDLLYRVTLLQNGGAFVEIHSSVKPNNCPSYMTQKYCVTSDIFERKLRSYKTVKFDILVNPHSRVDGKRLKLKTLQERLAWFKNKADHSGFEILFIKEKDNFYVTSKKVNQEFSFNVSQFQGVLKVVDFEKFYKNVVKGIGPEKAYGMGMFLFGA